MFDSVLVANRGEIACRVMRTARRLGLRTIAVYSEADAGALHVSMADEAWPVGPAAAADSYLRQDRILEVARASGAAAIHPGYGFLSENADFAEACAREGIIFIGPSPDSIRAMGSKSEAKALMGAASVPLVPGYHGEDQDPAFLKQKADETGYPLLIKATAGGGGKGMRIVASAEAFDVALTGAKREAMAAFGNDRVLLERYLPVARHIEVQIFGDSHGNVVHLFERDCSIQRRLQKVVEEAPAPGLSEDHRRALGTAAINAAKATNYQGAGTVEFIMDASAPDGDGAFYFMEMNTRLQVEHPVTEAITGQDLVEWQIRVAAGEPLPLTRAEIEARGPQGHAIEVRLYAEDAQKDFLPATGKLQLLHFPEAASPVEDFASTTPGHRIDSAVVQGDSVTPFYDPMIAKVIVRDHDRASAIRRLQSTLTECRLVGVTTNLAFLRRIACHDAFATGVVNTGFIPAYQDSLLPEDEPASPNHIALACLRLLRDREREARAARRNSRDVCSPWLASSGWRMNDEGIAPLRLTIPDQGEDQALDLLVHYQREAETGEAKTGGGGEPVYRLDLPGGQTITASLRDDDQIGNSGTLLRAVLDGVCRQAHVWRQGMEITVLDGGYQQRFRLFDPLHADSGEDNADGHLIAPMPGKVIALSVEAGQTVRAGQPLLVLEAMKMEHSITAPADGEVEELFYEVGDQVAEGAELLAFRPAGEKEDAA